RDWRSDECSSDLGDSTAEGDGGPLNELVPKVPLAVGDVVDALASLHALHGLAAIERQRAGLPEVLDVDDGVALGGEEPGANAQSPRRHLEDLEKVAVARPVDDRRSDDGDLQA